MGMSACRAGCSLSPILLPFAHRAINIPSRLLDALEIHKLEHEVETLLIHLSTDNVYDGSQSYYQESSPCHPVNVYGVSKRDAEMLIQVHKLWQYLQRKHSLSRAGAVDHLKSNIMKGKHIFWHVT